MNNGVSGVLMIFLLIFSQEALLQRLVMVGEGLGGHGIHFVNTVCPSLSEVADQHISLLIRCIFSNCIIFDKETFILGLYLSHCATWMYEGVIFHVRGGKSFP